MEIGAFVEKWIPITAFFGLCAEYIRLRWSRKAEEEKEIARIIPELLELRFAMHTLRELPPLLPNILKKIIPEEHHKQLTPELYAQLWPVVMPILQGVITPKNDGFAERYKKAVEGIGAFHPILAFQLRGKERYFDLRGVITTHFGKIGTSPELTEVIASLLDKECIPAIEDTILDASRANSLNLYWKMRRFLKKPFPDVNPITNQLTEMVAENFKQKPKPEQLGQTSAIGCLSESP